MRTRPGSRPPTTTVPEPSQGPSGSWSWIEKQARVPAETVPRGPMALATTEKGWLPTHASRLQKAMFPGGGPLEAPVIRVAQSEVHRRASLQDCGAFAEKHRATRTQV